MRHNYFKTLVGCFLLTAVLPSYCQVSKPCEQLSKMILLNHTSLANPTYVLPKGASNPQTFLACAFSVGDAVQQPLDYTVSKVPTDYYVNYSLNGFVCQRAKSFQLNLIANSSTTKAYSYAFADWDRDGIFETSLGKNEIKASSQGVPSTSYLINIPNAASLGKTRIRIYVTTADLATVNPTDEMASGYIYDFVVFTAEKATAATNPLVAAYANNPSWGTAVVSTPSPTNDGKYPVGTQVTINATPESGSSFQGWSNGTSIVSTEPSFTFKADTSVTFVAVFHSIAPTLEAPKISTAAAPVWYQIKIAITDARIDKCIAYSSVIPGGYTTQLRIESPVDVSDKFLWRLEQSADAGMVKLVNKGSNLQIYSNGATKTPLTMQSVGANFSVTPSGNSNGSYSIMYNGNSALLLNGRFTYDFVLYNGGAGGASGWYFYRVPDELFSTGVDSKFTPGFKIYSVDDQLGIDGLEKGTELSVFNILGTEVMKCKIESDAQKVPFSLKGMFIAMAKKNDQQISTCKFVR